jgi:hypothetical protein
VCDTVNPNGFQLVCVLLAQALLTVLDAPGVQRMRRS